MGGAGYQGCGLSPLCSGHDPFTHGFSRQGPSTIQWTDTGLISLQTNTVVGFGVIRGDEHNESNVYLPQEPKHIKTVILPLFNTICNERLYKFEHVCKIELKYKN